MSLPMSVDFDPEYGRWDFAPRVMANNEHGETGYLLSFDPLNGQFFIRWDCGSSEWVKKEEFKIIAGVVS